MNVKSTSSNLTTYAKSTSGGATETVTLAQGTGITGYSYNDLNELTSTSGGGAARFLGTTNKPIVSATINSTIHANLPNSTGFTANAALSTGSNASTLNIVDGNNNNVTNTYQVSVKGGPSATLTNDANGNMTSDGTNSYAWDAENRMIKIVYPGSGNYSTFVYDGLSRNATIVETVGGSVTSTKQFVWCGNDRCEQRNSSSTITAQFFGLGETINGTGYFWTKDHLGSVREMTNSSGAVQAEYAYDTYGRVTKLSATVPADFQYAGYYFHAPSGLNLTLKRAYNSNLGRWVSRDPLEEDSGTNLFGYVYNNPTGLIDPDGSDAIGGTLGGIVGGVIGGVIGKNPASVEEGAVIGGEIGSGLSDVAKAAAAAGIAYMAVKGRNETGQGNEYNTKADLNCSGRGFSAAQRKECICQYLQALYDFLQDKAERAKVYTAMKAAGCQRKPKRCK